jgi:hypothetical protein
MVLHHSRPPSNNKSLSKHMQEVTISMKYAIIYIIIHLLKPVIILEEYLLPGFNGYCRSKRSG